MECREARMEIEALLDGESCSGELKPHLASCETCRREVDERRVFSQGLRDSFNSALEGVESTPEDRALLLGKLCERRASPLPRVAAGIVIAVTLGLVAYALGLFGRTPADPPEVKQVAEMMVQKENQKIHAKALITELNRMTDELRGELPSDPEESPAEKAAVMEITAIEDKLVRLAAQENGHATPQAGVETLLRDLSSDQPKTRSAARRGLRNLGPEAIPFLEKALPNVRKSERWILREVIQDLKEDTGKVVISQSVDDKTIEFKQFGNAKVEIYIIDGGQPVKIEAKSMADLQKRYGEICKKYGISGRDGVVRVGGNEVGVDFDQRLDFVFSHLDDCDFDPIRMEAYTWALKKRTKSSREVETKTRELEKKMTDASRPGASWVSAGRGQDYETVLKNVRGWDETHRHHVRAQLEKDLKEMDLRILEIEALRGRLNGLKVYLNEVKSLKD